MAQQAKRRAGRAQRHVDPGPPLGFRFDRFLDRDAAHGRRRGDDLGSFQNARPIDNRIRQIVQRDGRSIVPDAETQ